MYDKYKWHTSFQIYNSSAINGSEIGLSKSRQSENKPEIKNGQIQIDKSFKMNFDPCIAYTQISITTVFRHEGR